MRITVEQADRLAQERPPYPAPSDDPAERCPGKTGWHRPQLEDWNRGNRESTCTWCQVPVDRKFCDPVWHATLAAAPRAARAARSGALDPAEHRDRQRGVPQDRGTVSVRPGTGPAAAGERGTRRSAA